MYWGQLSCWKKTFQDKGAFFSSGSKWMKTKGTHLTAKLQAGRAASVHNHKGNPYCNIIVWPEWIVHLPHPVQTDVGPKLEPWRSPWTSSILDWLLVQVWGFFFSFFIFLRPSDQPRRRDTFKSNKALCLALKLSNYDSSAQGSLHLQQ